MERYFILDKFNTWYDLHLVLTEKTISDAKPKTNYVELDGMSGSLDLSEVLTGEITYSDRTITAKFWTDYGNRRDREALLRKVTTFLHGKKIKIIEPDDPNHYFYGRIEIKPKTNNLAYAEFTLEAVCEPWRYANEETVRKVYVNSAAATNVVINNNGVKTLNPTVTVTGSVSIGYNGTTIDLSEGTYKITDIKLYQGVNIVSVSGNGTVIFTYREADL